MSGESEERLKKLVEKCVNSAELDEASMKTVRSLCRKDDSCIAIVVAELLWFLKRKHCVVRFEITEHFQKRKVVELEKEYFFLVRLRCLQLADSLFQRSHAFRVLLLKVSHNADRFDASSLIPAEHAGLYDASFTYP